MGLLFAATLPACAAPVYRPGAMQVPGGATIAYHVREGAGPNLVLIPGSFNDHRIFDRFVDHLPTALRVIIVELRGHGGSRPAASNPSMGLFASDVLQVTERLGLERYYVGGHSIGGMVAIEIAARRPDTLAGVISMEGWTHHRVATDAFGRDDGSTMTAEQQRLSDGQRERIRGKLGPAEISAFAAVWRSWDGLPILESTPVPVLELWGDRGRPRPTRLQMRIPERDNIELTWIAGASHPLLIQNPAETAARTASFIESAEVRHMFAVREPLAELPRLEGVQTITIYRGVEGITGFNMHPYIAAFDGRLWAMWSCNRIRDLQAGQYIRYATSGDGVEWSAPGILSPPEERQNLRSFARGFWMRGPHELIALVARDEAVRPLFGPGLSLRGFRWNGSGWQEPFEVARDTINNFAPERLRDGRWMMTRRDHKMRIGMLAGGVSSPSDWDAIALREPADGAALDEPVWWALPGGRLTAAFRDGSKSRRLYRSFSEDGGATWTAPIRTDFPDAMAKFNVVRLSNGLYAMASNPNTNGKRIPLCLSLSEDGRVFTRMGVLRDAPTVYRYAGKDPGYAGYHYPQLLEHRGFLYVIHAENMEDIVLLRVPVARVGRFARGSRR
jgi:pimeloyl-ACP methyl ester carboxylesterase